VAIVKCYLGGGDVGRANANPSTEGDAAAERPSTSTSTADRYQVVVHVDESALRGGIGRADLPIETVQRLCCDGSLITVLEDERGRPLDVGRKQRTVSTALRRALWSRDRGCSFPAASTRATSTCTISTTGPTAAPRGSTTSRCSARTTTRCFTKAASRFIATRTAR